MVVVNPYLKKKKPASSGGPPPASLALRHGTAGRGLAKTLPPQHVTPSKHTAAASRPTCSKPAGSQKVPSKALAPKGTSMVTPGKMNPSSKPVLSSSLSDQKRPQSGSTPAPGTTAPATAVARNPAASARSKSSMTGRMSLKKGGGSLKQQLKQEIAMLKRQKQLKKLQKEAEERRSKMTAEKQERDQERQALFATMDEERKQKHAERERAIAQHLQEQHRKQQERVVQQERKREEKDTLEQMRQQREEELWQQQKRQAEFKYQQELQLWKYKHQLWLQQQQQHHVQMAQQQQNLGYPYYGSTVPQQTSFHPGLEHLQPHSFHHANHFNMMAWNLPPPPPPPRPPVLCRKPQRSLANHAQSQDPSKPSAHHLSRLCQPMQSPSPFAQQGRRLLTVTLIRNPQAEPSYGVSLIVHKVSALVNPDWLDAQEARKVAPEAAAAATKSAEEAAPSAVASTDVNHLIPASICSTSQAISSPVDSPGSGAVTPTVVGSSDAKLEVQGDAPANSCGTPVSAGPTNSDCTVNSAPKSPNTSNETAATCHEKSTDASADSSISPKADISEQPLAQDVSPGSSSNKSSRTESETGTGLNVSPLETVGKEQAEETVVQGTATGPNASKANAVVSAPVASTNDHSTRKRRRRVNFAVMLVREAEKQNSRQPNVSADMKLQAGDIVVAIGDQNLSDMTFTDACKVFSSKAEKVNESRIQTTVIVARKKMVLATPRPIASSMTVNHFPSNTVSTYQSNAPSLLTNDSMDFSPPEIAMLANGFQAGLHSRNRMLGQGVPDSIWAEIAAVFRSASQAKSNAISNRSSETLKRKWQLLTRTKDFSAADKARQFWAGKFREDFGEVELPFSSYVEQCALRQAARGGPRPAKGCRCGKLDHDYLFDSKCLLYADLRQRLSSEELEELLPKNTKAKLSSREKKALNAVTTANQTRMLKLKESTEKEKAEDRFVAKMEEIQVKELKRAVYAPSLSSIVLSAISELQREFPLPKEDEASDDEDDDDEIDEDDDVPLVSLGKRNATTEESSYKQQKISHDDDPKISLHYVVRLVEYISKTWGHCYREPAQLDFSWRWEVFHGTYSSDQQWDPKSVNPRPTNSLPFQNVQFELTASKSICQDLASMPDRVKQLEDSLLSGQLSSVVAKAETATGSTPVGTVQQSSLTPESLDHFCLAVHCLSPFASGLYEEILALLQMEVLKVRSGIPVFTRDWWEKADILVLDDMTTYWSSEVDPDGKYCINEEFRDTLEEKWIKYDYGFALSEYPKELIFEYGVLDEWKETFEDRLEENENRSEGIGRFGL